MNSLNSVKRKILNNFQSFTEEFNNIASENRVLCNSKSVFISYVLYNFSFVEFSKFGENIQIRKTQMNNSHGLIYLTNNENILFKI